MTNTSSTILYYVHDPMCSWCWGFREEWLKLKQLLPEHIQVVSKVGGLAEDSDEPMQESLQRDIQLAWQRIQQVIPGTRFNFDFWTDNTPRRSTYPACRAVLAAEQLAQKGVQMTFGIQQAYYLNAQNPSDLSTLIDVAISIGLDTNEFRDLILSDDIKTALHDELAQVRSIDVYSFPSLVLQINSRFHPVQLDYNSAQNMLEEISSLLSSQNV